MSGRGTRGGGPIGWRAATRRRALFLGSGKVRRSSGLRQRIILGLLSLGVAIESVRRFIEPVSVHYAEALFSPSSAWQ